MLHSIFCVEIYFLTLFCAFPLLYFWSVTYLLTLYYQLYLVGIYFSTYLLWKLDVKGFFTGVSCFFFYIDKLSCYYKYPIDYNLCFAIFPEPFKLWRSCLIQNCFWMFKSTFNTWLDGSRRTIGTTRLPNSHCSRYYVEEQAHNMYIIGSMYPLQ